MKKFLMVLVALFFISGCAARQVVRVPDAVQKFDTRENRECAEANYQNDGSVFIRVNCHERIIHAVTRLRPVTNYAVFIGNDPIMIVKTSVDGILVFVNQHGRNVEIIPEMSEEEIKKIKIKKGGE